MKASTRKIIVGLAAIVVIPSWLVIGACSGPTHPPYKPQTIVKPAPEPAFKPVTMYAHGGDPAHKAMQCYELRDFYIPSQLLEAGKDAEAIAMMQKNIDSGECVWVKDGTAITVTDMRYPFAEVTNARGGNSHMMTVELSNFK